MDEDLSIARAGSPPSRWQRFRRWVSRLVSGEPTQVNVGADWQAGTSTAPAYPTVNSMSAAASLAWVYACIQARSEDLAGLPLKVTIGGRLATDRHPVLDLLNRPNSWSTEEQLRRQLYVDRGLCGNAFVLQLYSGSRVVSLARLHPDRIRVSPASTGGALKYEYADGSGQEWAPSAMLHIRGPSWEDDPRSLWGLGRIQPLHVDLTAELASAKLAAKAAAMGRPDVVLSPMNAGDTFDDGIIKKIKRSWDDLFRRQSGGAVVLGGGVKLDVLSWTPKDMGHDTLQKANREKILAVFSVPPVRVGLETANYATAKEQSRVYWQSLQAEARLFDAAFTQLAQRMGYRDVQVWHDFSGVDVLQEGQTARLARVQVWVALGASPKDAAAYEGFEDAPVPGKGPAPAPADPPSKGHHSNQDDWWPTHIPEAK